MVEHIKIKKYNTAHKQKQEQKSRDHINRCRKSLWQNSISFHDKSSEEIVIEGMYLNIINSS
jgi:hypothetical protein